jgi:hypothetical protein
MVQQMQALNQQLEETVRHPATNKITQSMSECLHKECVLWF